MTTDPPAATGRPTRPWWKTTSRAHWARTLETEEKIRRAVRKVGDPGEGVRSSASAARGEAIIRPLPGRSATHGAPSNP